MKTQHVNRTRLFAQRSLVSIMSILLVSASMACATTDPEEAEDLALSSEDYRSGEMESSESDAAQVEADFAMEGEDQPLTAESAESEGEFDPFAPQEGQAATEDQLEDPFASVGEGSETNTDAFANESSPEEESILDASQEVASDLPEEPAVIEEFSDLTAGEEAVSEDQAIVDPFASSEQVAEGEASQPADPFAGFDDTNSGQGVAVAESADSVSAGEVSDPFAGFDSSAEATGSDNQFEAAAVPADPFAKSSSEDSFADDGSAQVADQGVPADPFASNATAQPVDSYFEPAPAAAPVVAQEAAAIPADPFAGVDDSAANDPYGVTPASDNTPSQPVVAQASPASRAAASREQGDGLGQTSNFTYIVAPGDTLSEIAEKIYGSVSEWRTIASANGISEPHLIFPGDILQVQSFGSASAFAQAYASVPEQAITVQAGETLFSIAERLMGSGSSWKYIWKLNEAEIPNPNVLRPGQVIRYRDFRDVQASL